MYESNHTISTNRQADQQASLSGIDDIRKTTASSKNAEIMNDFAQGKVSSVNGMTSSFCSSKDCEDEQAAYEQNENSDIPEGMAFLKSESLVGQAAENTPDTRFNQNQYEKSQDDNGALDDNAAMDLLMDNDPDQMIVEDVVQVREAMEKPDESGRTRTIFPF